MISHSSVRARSFRPTFSGFGRGLIVALTALAFFIGFEVSELRARSGAQPAIETVNRALKGDRLLATPAFQPAAAERHHEIKAPRETVSNSQLPIGCDPLISPLVNRQLSRIASRCIS
jgi:hypothetical protein